MASFFIASPVLSFIASPFIASFFIASPVLSFIASPFIASFFIASPVLSFIASPFIASAGFAAGVDWVAGVACSVGVVVAEHEASPAAAKVNPAISPRNLYFILIQLIFSKKSSVRNLCLRFALANIRTR